MTGDGNGARRSKRIGRPQVLRLGSFIAVLVAWEVIGRQDPIFASYPLAIVQASWEILVLDPALTRALGESLWGFTVGYGLAIIAALAIAFLMAQSHVIDIALLPYMNALYALPRIALIPLLILLAGIEFRLRVLIVFLSAFFPMLIIVRDGALSVAKEYKDTARSFAASRWQLWRTATLPGSLPSVFSAMRVGAQRALIGIIVAETIAAYSGTGRLLTDYGRFFQTDKVLVVIIVIGFFSILLTAILRRLQRSVTPWAQPPSADSMFAK